VLQGVSSLCPIIHVLHLPGQFGTSGSGNDEASSEFGKHEIEFDESYNEFDVIRM